jgi:DNA-binding MarR family transcriptional regulator
MQRIKFNQERPQGTLLAHVTRPADAAFLYLVQALLKASFLFFNQPGRPDQDYDLTASQLDVLAALARSEDNSLTCSDIAEKTFITKSGLTGVLDRLAARALVDRTPSHEDRRSIRIALTPAGVELFCKLYPNQRRFYRAVLEKVFSPGQIEEFGQLLDQLIGGLKKA